jgi:hypothetical protein
MDFIASPREVKHGHDLEIILLLAGVSCEGNPSNCVDPIWSRHLHDQIGIVKDYNELGEH